MQHKTSLGDATVTIEYEELMDGSPFVSAVLVNGRWVDSLEFRPAQIKVWENEIMAREYALAAIAAHISDMQGVSA